MYECPNCGANLKFDISSQQLACEHCGTGMDPYAFQKERDAEEYEVTIFTCPQCGGELISDENTAATFCSFCGGATILDSRISSERRPAYIIPFQKTKEDCKKAYAKMLRKAVFAPKELKDEDQLEHFRSIYMPYWVYSFEKVGPVSFQGKRVHQQGDYEITDYYQIESDMDAEFKGLAFDASASFSDNLSNAISPFWWSEVKPFTPSFLSGFYADTNDVESHVYEDGARQIVKEELCSRMEQDPVCKKYSLIGLKKSMEPETVQKDLAMFPVWFLSYRKKDRVCYAVVNGQTGKVAADLPIDSKKYLLGSLLLALPIFLLLNLIVSMRASSMLIWTGVLSLICAIVSVVQKRKLFDRETYADDIGLAYYKQHIDPDRFAVKDKSGTEPSKEASETKEISFLSSLILVLGLIFIGIVPMSFMGRGGMLFLMLVWTGVWTLAWMYLKPGKRKKKATGKEKLSLGEWMKAMGKPMIGILLVIAVLIRKPVSDLYYYAAALVSMGLIAWNIVEIIVRYNMLTTRKLPQFNKRGGEENA